MSSHLLNPTSLGVCKPSDQIQLIIEICLHAIYSNKICWGYKGNAPSVTQWLTKLTWVFFMHAVENGKARWLRSYSTFHYLHCPENSPFHLRHILLELFSWKYIDYFFVNNRILELFFPNLFKHPLRPIANIMANSIYC